MSSRPLSGHDLGMNEPNFHGTKKLYRVREGRVVAGVCAGLAAHFGIDPTLVRLGFALFTIFGGAGILLYLCAWIVIPEEGGDGSSIAESFVSKRRS
jgi:phage shock protein PspC (stress-responsive transcriptional regulator)